jgi:hypothetical protein
MKNVKKKEGMGHLPDSSVDITVAEVADRLIYVYS